MSTPSLANRARRVLQAARVSRDDALLLACSGGVDSQVLLEVLSHVRSAHRGETRGFRLFAMGIDHGLRAHAAEELALARSLAASLDVPFATASVQVARGGNVQARARDARWQALRHEAARVGARFIATGHHRDDRAETVLIRILRGAPIAGLAVLPAIDGDRIRPLIDAPRADIERHAETLALPFARDPSNEDPRYLRTRVRRELLPLLRALDARIDDHLCRLADEASDVPIDALAAALRQKAPHAKGRAIDALIAASKARRRNARVWLGDGLEGRWTERGGIVVASGSASRRPKREDS